MTTQSNHPNITRKLVCFERLRTDQRYLVWVIPNGTSWLMFRTAKITRSLSSRKCGTGNGPALLVNFLAASRLSKLKTATVRIWIYKSQWIIQDSTLHKIPSGRLQVKRTTFKLVPTTRICAISMKKNFKYSTKLKR